MLASPFRVINRKEIIDNFGSLYSCAALYYQAYQWPQKVFFPGHQLFDLSPFSAYKRTPVVRFSSLG